MSMPNGTDNPAVTTPVLVVRDEVTTVRTVVSVGHVDGDALGTLGWFLGVRNRHHDPALDARDRRKYGTCVICHRALTDDEQIHMVFGVVRNGKTAGNRLCCGTCAEKHATIHTRSQAGA